MPKIESARLKLFEFLSCRAQRIISKHWSTLSFSGLQHEINLVLSRAALFDQERIKSITIWTRHRAALGISWTYKRWRNKVQSSTGDFRTRKIKSSRQRRMLPQRIEPAGHERTSQRYQVAFRRDFSDPQGGKGSFDWKAAAIKNHVKAYLNSGSDVETLNQIKRTTESDNGIPGVRAILYDPPTVPKSELFNPFPSKRFPIDG